MQNPQIKVTLMFKLLRLWILLFGVEISGIFVLLKQQIKILPSSIIGSAPVSKTVKSFCWRVCRIVPDLGY